MTPKQSRNNVLLYFHLIFLLFLMVPTGMAMEEDPIIMLEMEAFDTKIMGHVLNGDITMINHNKKEIFQKERNVFLSQLARKAGYEELAKALLAKWRWGRWAFAFLPALKSETKTVNKIKKALFEGASGGNLDKLKEGLKSAKKKNIDAAAVINHLQQTPVDVAEEKGRVLTAAFIRNFVHLAQLNKKKFPSNEEIKEDLSSLKKVSPKYSSSMTFSASARESPKNKRKKRQRSPSPEKSSLEDKAENVLSLNLGLERKPSQKTYSVIIENVKKHSPKMPRKKRSNSPAVENLWTKPPTPADVRAENLFINQQLILSAYKHRDFSEFTDDIMSHEVFEKLIEKKQEFDGTMLHFIMEQHQKFRHWDRSMWALLKIMQLTKSPDEIDAELQEFREGSSDYKRAWLLSILPKGFKETDVLLNNAEAVAERARKIGQEALSIALEENRYIMLFDKEKLRTMVCQKALQQSLALH